MDDEDYAFEIQDPEFTLTLNDENIDKATHTSADNTGNNVANIYYIILVACILYCM